MFVSQLRLSLFGPPRLERDDQPLELDNRKVAALLAYLAISGHSQSRDGLAALLWPDYDQSTARSYLRYSLWALKKALGGTWLAVERETIGLVRGEGFWLDVAHFQARLAACRTHDHPGDAVCPACLPLLAEAVELYQGDFLAGFTLPDAPDFDEWQFFQSESLRQQLAGALDRLVRGHSAQREYEPAIGYARRWLALDPLHEPVQRQLMQLYNWAGQSSAALRQYQECLRLFEVELGLPPEAETTELYEAIKAKRALPPPASLSVAEQKREGEGRFSPAPLDSLIPAPAGLPVTLLEWPDETADTDGFGFVARERELAQLDEFLQRTLSGQGQVVFVTGEAGSGKTALLREFARRKQTTTVSLIIASGHCNAQFGLGDPYLPFRRILRLLTGDVETEGARGVLNRRHAEHLWAYAPVVTQALVEHGPDLINIFVAGPALSKRVQIFAPIDADWRARLEKLVLVGAKDAGNLGQGDLFEQYCQVLQAVAQQWPLMLIIDDLHWADAASLSLLFHLGRRLASSRILIVGSYRPDEMALGRGSERHPLQPVVNELRSVYGEVVVDLDQAREREFVEALLDSQPNQLGPAFRATLYRHTQGQPLFTVELLRAMQAGGEIVPDEAGRWVEGPTLVWGHLPTRVEAVIKERLDRLPAVLREILAVASVEGEVFTAQVVARILDSPERPLLQQLSRELEKQYRLIHRREEIQVGQQFLSRYQFSHVLFQQYLYDEASAAERRLLHGEIAATLATLYAGRTEEITVQLAHHYAAAGERGKAVDYLLLAGDRARGLYAHQEAIEAYQQALVFLKEQENYERAARTLMKLGLTYHLAFDFRQARQAYEGGFALWQRAGEEQGGTYPPAPHALRLDWFDPPTLDPTMAGTTTSGKLIEQLFSGLVALSPELDIVPDLARTWEVLEGGRKYIFHLRGDIRWSDGSPVTAEDFVYAWRRALNPATGSYNANLLHDVKGARAFHQGQISDPNQLGVRALSAVTLVVELAEPTSYFLHLMTKCASYPVPQHIVETYGQAWTKVENIVSNGPFRLEAWHPGQSMVLSRNPAYHRQFTGNVQQVELCLFPFEESSAKLALYEADALDILEHLPPSEWVRVRRRYAGEYLLQPWLLTRYAGFDVSRPPFDDARVRRAFVLATDKERLANVTMGGYHLPATGGLIPPGMPGHSAGIGLPYDPEQARQLLAEAGYPGGQGFPSVEGLKPPYPEYELLSESLQIQWREQLGVEITWAPMDWGVTRLNQEPPPLFLIAWSADYPDPDNFLRVAGQDGGWWNEAFAGLVEKAGQVTDQGERLKLYGQADRIVVETAIIIPLFYGRSHLLVKPWVNKLPASAISRWFWQDVVIGSH